VAALHTAVVVPSRVRVDDLPLVVPGWPPGLDGLRVAVLADLHVGAPWVGLPAARRLVDRVAAARPDLVLLLGDHLADVHLGTRLDPEPGGGAPGGRRDTAPGPARVRRRRPAGPGGVGAAGARRPAVGRRRR
jgi:hypothetical protein